MSLAPGTRVGPYEVLSLLGEGGMGQVYRARDLTLDRDVALKVLPVAVANEPERVRRFEREAKTLASLNHPNIAQIYGVVGVDEGARGAASPSRTALVMELVQGPTLEEVLNRRAASNNGSFASVAWAVPVAIQIARALEAAHEAGIVHRDLKPANVKLRDDDEVKVLDFGLARMSESAEGPNAATFSSPTLLSPAATQQGVILGTAGYMSPEQARGRTVDKRADIWAFGVVLYQMLAGRRLFDGESVTEIVAAVIKDTPDLSALPADTPPRVRHVIERCLERDPKERMRDIGEARIALQRADAPGSSGPAAITASGPVDIATSRPLTDSESATGPQAGARPPRAASRNSLWIAAILAVAGLGIAGLAVGAASIFANRPPLDLPVRRIDLPKVIAETRSALSPDGRRIAYISGARLFVHDIESGTAADLGAVPAVTEGLFFSADSQRIVYGAESELRAVPIAGGAPFILCKVPASGRVLDGFWHDDGRVYFVVWREHAYKVAATGGTPEVVARIDTNNEIDFHSISALSDGRMLLTTHLRGVDGARLDISDSGARKPLSDDATIIRARAVGPDRVMFSRDSGNIGVWVAPLEGATLDLARATVIEPRATHFDVSSEGTLIARVPARERRDLLWVAFGAPRRASDESSADRSTTLIPGRPFDAATSQVAISSDQRRAAMTVRPTEGREEFLVRDLATGADTRVPLPPVAGARTDRTMGGIAGWTPGGRLLVAFGGVEASHIYDWPADGTANGRTLVRGLIGHVMPDGKSLIFNRDERAKMTLYRAPLLADGTAGQETPVFSGPDVPNVHWFDVSPDGSLLAYTATNATNGQTDLFLATYPDLGERVQLTSAGGSQPRFSHDSTRLFYLSVSRTTASTPTELRVATITRAPLRVSVPRLLMTNEGARLGGPDLGGYDVAADGRVLVTRVAPAAPGDEARLVWVQNWNAVKR